MGAHPQGLAGDLRRGNLGGVRRHRAPLTAAAGLLQCAAATGLSAPSWPPGRGRGGVGGAWPGARPLELDRAELGCPPLNAGAQRRASSALGRSLGAVQWLRAHGAAPVAALESPCCPCSGTARAAMTPFVAGGRARPACTGMPAMGCAQRAASAPRRGGRVRAVRPACCDSSGGVREQTTVINACRFAGDRLRRLQAGPASCRVLAASRLPPPCACEWQLRCSSCGRSGVLTRQPLSDAGYLQVTGCGAGAGCAPNVGGAEPVLAAGGRRPGQAAEAQLEDEGLSRRAAVQQDCQSECLRRST